MSLNIWERQADLLRLKIAQCHKDMWEMQQMLDTPTVQQSSVLVAQIQRVQAVAESTLERYEAELGQAMSFIK